MLIKDFENPRNKRNFSSFFTNDDDSFFFPSLLDSPHSIERIHKYKPYKLEEKVHESSLYNLFNKTVFNYDIIFDVVFKNSLEALGKSKHLKYIEDILSNRINRIEKNLGIVHLIMNVNETNLHKRYGVDKEKIIWFKEDKDPKNNFSHEKNAFIKALKICLDQMQNLNLLKKTISREFAKICARFLRDNYEFGKCWLKDEISSIDFIYVGVQSEAEYHSVNRGIILSVDFGKRLGKKLRIAAFIPIFDAIATLSANNKNIGRNPYGYKSHHGMSSFSLGRDLGCDLYDYYIGINTMVEVGHGCEKIIKFIHDHLDNFICDETLIHMATQNFFGKFIYRYTIGNSIQESDLRMYVSGRPDKFILSYISPYPNFMWMIKEERQRHYDNCVPINKFAKSLKVY